MAPPKQNTLLKRQYSNTQCKEPSDRTIKAGRASKSVKGETVINLIHLAQSFCVLYKRQIVTSLSQILTTFMRKSCIEQIDARSLVNLFSYLGMIGCPKLDEFGKTPNGPPPRPCFGKLCCAFPGNPKILQQIFGSPPPPFHKFTVFFQKFMTKFPQKSAS